MSDSSPNDNEPDNRQLGSREPNNNDDAEDGPEVTRATSPLDRSTNDDPLDAIPETLLPELTGSWSDLDLDQTSAMTSLRPTLSGAASDTSPAEVRHRAIGPADEQAADADYLTLHLLGEGGMGTVRLAQQVSLGRSVAIKQIRDTSRHQPLVQQEFLTEAVLTGKLEHPNIVPIYELGRSTDGDLFYAMKNVKGQAWSDTIDDLTVDANLSILNAVCDAIAFAHAEGVIHRDLKPQNIMTGGFGEVLVLDWGLALIVGSNTSVNGSLAGTMAYMAPEMAQLPCTVGRYCDIYLLGGILFQILTGKPPHPGKSSRDCLLGTIRNLIVAPDVERLERLDPSGELMGIAMRAMSYAPQERYASVTGFQHAIRDFQLHHESLELAIRAQHSLDLAEQQRNYEHYSRAVFGFEEALQLWDQNDRAADGVGNAKRQWAVFAEEQRDYDLALSLLDANVADHAPIRTRVKTAKVHRDSQQRQARRFRAASIAAGILLLIGAVAFGAYQNQVSNQLASQRDKIAQQFHEITIKQQETQTALAAENAAKLLAEQQRQNAERQLYVNHIQSAKREWDTNHAGSAWQHLEACREEYQGWEYRYLHSLFTRESEVLSGQTVWVNSLAISADGLRLVSGSADNTVKIWDMQSKKELMTLEKSDQIQAVAISHDEKRIAGVNSGSLTIWNAETGKLVQSVENKGGEGFFRSLQFSADDRYILACAENVIRIREVDSGEEYQSKSTESTDDIFWSATFSPDGQQYASGGFLETTVWDFKTGEEVWSQDKPLYSVAYSPDGKQLLVNRGGFLILDASNGEELLRLEGHDLEKPVAFSADGEMIAGATVDGQVVVWNAKTGKQMRKLTGHRNDILSVAFTPDGSRIVSGSRDHDIRIWSLDTVVETSIGILPSICLARTISPDGSSLAFTGKSLDLFDLNAGSFSNQRTLIDHNLNGQVGVPAFSPDGLEIACGDFVGKIRFRNVATGVERLSFQAHQHESHSLAFSPDGDRLVSKNLFELKVWDVNNGGLLLTIPCNESEPINFVSFSPDGSLIASEASFATSPGPITIWDAKTGERKLTLHDHVHSQFTFSPNGQTIVAGGQDNNLNIWDVYSGELLSSLSGHSGQIASVGFSPDGQRIASSSHDGTIKIWDPASGQLTLTLVGCQGCPVSWVAFSRDGSLLYADRSVWDASIPGPDVRSKQDKGNEDLILEHVYRASNAEQSKDFYAAAFHLGWLVAYEPQESSWQTRRNAVVAELKERGLAIPAIPSQEMVLNHLARLAYPLLADSKQTPGMERRLKQLLTRQPLDADFASRIHAVLGMHFFGIGDFDQALTHLAQSNSESQSNSLFLALAHHKLGQKQQAAEAMGTALLHLTHRQISDFERPWLDEAIAEITDLTSADEERVSLIRLCGAYAMDPVTNDWETGSISIEHTAPGNPPSLRWTNKAKRSWQLFPDFKNNLLRTDSGNPYFETDKVYTLKESPKNSAGSTKYEGFFFRNGLYKRTGS